MTIIELDDSNQFNRQQYSEHVKDYLESNSDGKIGGGTPSERVDFLATILTPGKTVFEIGSGGGNDAIALRDKGYKVLASDFVQVFVDAIEEKGLEAVLFDAKQDEFPEGIDAVYANAVLVHFSPAEIKAFLQKAKSQLRNDKVIFISVLKGEGSERSARGRGFERDFHYYTLVTLSQLLEESGFTVVKANDEDAKWLQVICKAF